MAVQRSDEWVLRPQVYAFLGNSLLHPMSSSEIAVLGPDFWRAFPIVPTNSRMEISLRKLALVAESFADEDARVRLATEFTRLFVGPGTPSAPPWESMYRGAGRFLFGQPTFDMRELFRERGLALSSDAHQLEDHMGVELLYLAAVGERFPSASEDGGGAGRRLDVEDLRQQIDFIDRHPLGWIEAFHSRVKAYSNTGYYAALVELTWGVLLWDKELLEEACRRPLSSPVFSADM